MSATLLGGNGHGQCSESFWWRSNFSKYSKSPIECVSAMSFFQGGVAGGSKQTGGIVEPPQPRFLGRFVTTQTATTIPIPIISRNSMLNPNALRKGFQQPGLTIMDSGRFGEG